MTNTDVRNFKEATPSETGQLSEAAQKRLQAARRIETVGRGPLGWKRLTWLILLLAVGLAVLPALGVAQTNQRLIALVLIFAAYAMSYDLLFGYTGIFSFGHALFFGVGAYSSALFAVKLGWPIWAGTLAGVLICALLGLAIGFVSLRVQGVFFAMITLALASTAHSLAGKWVDFTRGDEGLSLLQANDAPDGTTVYFLALGLVAVTYFGLNRFVGSPLGKVLISIRENERRATMIGYNVLAYKVVAIVFSAAIASLAGSLFACRNGIINPGVLSGDMSIMPLLMVILGGAGTLYGAIIGAVIIQSLNFVLSSREFVEGVKNWFILGPILEHWLLILGLIYVLIVLFLPYGLVGTWKIYWPKLRKKFSK